MDFSRYEALSFDVYGTLIDWESGIAAVLVPWAERQGLDLGREQLLEAYAGHEARAEAEHGGELYPAILRRAFAGTASALGARVEEADLDAFAASVPDWPAFDDSARALADLATRYRLIVLSNVDRESYLGSARRLEVGFDGLVTAQDVGAYKPDGRMFEALRAEAARLGVAEGGLLHVAQSVFHDHVPARAAGLPSVWIDRRGGGASGAAGWGATPAPQGEAAPLATYPSMAAFAAAALAAGGPA